MKEKISKQDIKDLIKKGYRKVDTYAVNDWFLNIIPNMLEDMLNNLHGYPDFCDGIKDWRKLLEKMVETFREANESTCSKQNIYEQEYLHASDEFTEKYGLFGEKLLTKEEKERGKKTDRYVVHRMDELPEYKDISKKYFDRELEIMEYRAKKKEEALKLFVKHFDDLWD